MFQGPRLDGLPGLTNRRPGVGVSGLLVGCFAATVFAQPVMLDPAFAISDEQVALVHPTQVAFSPGGDLYIATQAGDIFSCEYGPGGIVGTVRLRASSVGALLLGIAFDSAGDLFASSNEGADDTGFLARLRDEDGDGEFERVEKFVTSLPNNGHHNDQLVIDGMRLYVGMGSRTDDGEQDDVEPVPAATILTINLSTVDFDAPDNLPEVYAYGFRNAFGLALDEQLRLWAADNGRDSPLLPEELHLVLPGAHHGFPDELAPPDAVEPVVTLGLGTSADGLSFCPSLSSWPVGYQGNLFMSRFDWELNNPALGGQDVVRVTINELPPAYPTATFEVFADEFNRPLDVEFDPFGQMVVMEYGSYAGDVMGRIYRVASIQPEDFDADGDVDLHDFGLLQSCFTGQDSGPVPENCDAADLDNDVDVDLFDFATWKSALTGP